MAWEDTEHDRGPCPCGKGREVWVSSSNDWNQHRDWRALRCDECANKYALADERGPWLPKEEVQRIQAARDQERARREREYREKCRELRRRLGVAVVAATSHHRSRKALFQAIETRLCRWIDSDSGYPTGVSLYRFEKQVRVHGRDKVLVWLIRPETAAGAEMIIEEFTAKGGQVPGPDEGRSVDPDYDASTTWRPGERPGWGRKE